MPTTFFRSLLKQYFFWMLFFAMSRTAFLVYHFPELSEPGFIETLRSFFIALRLDTSAAAYLLGLPWILLSFQIFIPKKVFFKINNVIVYIFIILVSLIVVSEMEIYNQWGTKLSAKALQYLTQPTEIFQSLSNKLFFVLISLWILLSLTGIYFYKRFFAEHKLQVSTKLIPSISAILFTGGLMVLLIRGGFQQIPINLSDAYYSKYDVLNAAAVNPSWNLGQSIDQNSRMLNKNPFITFSKDEAKFITDSLHHVEKDTTVLLLSSSRPNIVMIILEGVSADMLSSLGGYKETAPNLDRLANEGYLFTEFYSSGDRSEQGMAAILSGFPAQPITSILRQPTKFKKLPSLVKSLSDEGYETSFYFGGQLSYGNIKAYLMSNGIDKIIELENFDSDIHQGKLGVHDEFVLQKQLDDLDKMKTPFFSTVFTLSSHTPYDFPGIHKFFPWAKSENGYVNGIMYSDSCIGDFIKKASSKKWYSNTLFVFVSDHSHATPKQNDFFSAAHRKIPCILYGDVLLPEFKGKKNGNTASQIDISTTLLAQLKINRDRYIWSKNLMNPYSLDFAFCAFHEGSSGWIEGNNSYAYNLSTNIFHQNNFIDSMTRKNIIRKQNAYLQTMFSEYLEY